MLKISLNLKNWIQSFRLVGIQFKSLKKEHVKHSLAKDLVKSFDLKKKITTSQQVVKNSLIFLRYLDKKVSVAGPSSPYRAV